MARVPPTPLMHAMRCLLQGMPHASCLAPQVWVHTRHCPDAPDSSLQALRAIKDLPSAAEDSVEAAAAELLDISP